MVGSFGARAGAVAVALGSVLAWTGSAGAVGSPAPPVALVHRVTTGADDGSSGTFRAALEGATSEEPHEVVVDPSVRTITLDDCDDGRVMVESPTAGPITIVGNGATVVQTCVGEGVLGSVGGLTIHDLTITGGFAFDSGGGLVLGGPSVLDGVTVRDNASAGTGGGVAAQEVTLIRSTISGNRARFAGGGVSGTRVTVDTSTISGNAAELGSGIASAGDIALSFATVTSNDEGPNLLVGEELATFGSAIGLGGTNCVFSPIGSVRSLGYNVQAFTDPSVLPDTSCRLDAATDRALHPWLSTLGDHGGPTTTKVPRSASPLIDAIPATEPACASAGADQRGIPRPERGSCDIGAVEVRTPVARDQALTVPSGGTVAIDLLAAVDDPDDLLAEYSLGAPGHGTLHPTASGTGSSACGQSEDDVEDRGPVLAICRLTVQPPAHAPMPGFLFPRSLSVVSYSADPGFSGTDSIAYELCSAGGVVCTGSRTITITVAAAAVPVEPRFTG